MVSSMTDADHCAQNAIAERVNGVLKDEFFLDAQFHDFHQAWFAIRSAVDLYNTERFHMSLGYSTPQQVHFLAAA